MTRPWAAAILLGSLFAGCGRPPGRDAAELGRRAYAALERGDLQLAVALADEAAVTAGRGGAPQDAWRLRVLRAELLMKRRKAQEALYLLSDRLPAGAPADVRIRASMTEGYARCYLATRGAEAGDRGEAEMLAAEHLAREEGLDELRAEVLLRRGTCASFDERTYTAAEDLFRQALVLGSRAGLRRIESDAAGALGNLRTLESRYDDAADWLQRSKTLAAEFDPDAIDVKILTNLGWCYSALGDTERAMPLLREATVKARRYGYAEEAYLSLAHLGNCHLRLGDLVQARRLYAEALPIVRELGFDDEREILELLQIVSLKAGDQAAARHYELEAAQARTAATGATSAVALVQADLAVVQQDFRRAERIYREILASASSLDARWRAQAGLARLCAATGRLDEAEAAFERARSAIERFRAELEQDTYDFLVYSSLTDFYGSYAAFLVDRGRAAAGLAVVEGARGRVLWERVRSQGSRRPSLDRFERVARERRAVLLSYWTGERSFVWMVDGATTRVHELPKASLLQSKVERYQSLLLGSADPLALSSREGAELYDLLIGPVADAIPKGARVIVVADGPLHQLSFDTLVVSSERPRYWLEDVVTLRAPSLSLLSQRKRRAAPPDRALLVVGDPIQPNDAFPALPNAAREIRAVESHFPAAASVVLTGAAATPSGFRAASPERFGVIHFAAHATSNGNRPLESAVVLSQDGFEYKLYARDVVGMPLRADVVTVSACEGAGVRAYGGEGLVGFAWAFLEAGARHVVAGLWEVEDASTADLMDAVYRGRAGGLDPATALRDAKLVLLHSRSAHRKPYYWGPFVVFVQ